MVEPLKDPAFSGRVYVSFGIPTWPNGFELDAIALHIRPDEAGQLVRPTAAK
jgi:hypothetical protein